MLRQVRSVLVSLLALVFTIGRRRFVCEAIAAMTGPRLGDARIVFQTTFGDIEMALYPDVWSPDRSHAAFAAHTKFPKVACYDLFIGGTGDYRPYIEAGKAWRIQQ